MYKLLIFNLPFRDLLSKRSGEASGATSSERVFDLCDPGALWDTLLPEYKLEARQSPSLFHLSGTS